MSLLIFQVYLTGEKCPISGIWKSEESEDLIIISKGEKFPPLNKKNIRWKLKKKAVPQFRTSEEMLAIG